MAQDLSLNVFMELYRSYTFETLREPIRALYYLFYNEIKAKNRAIISLLKLAFTDHTITEIDFIKRFGQYDMTSSAYLDMAFWYLLNYDDVFWKAVEKYRSEKEISSV